MKTKWLNLVLLLTNRIYGRKQNILAQTGIQTVWGIAVLIVLEIFLAIISLPIYLTTKSAGVVAFFEEKGGYEKVAFDYNLRRVLTVTGVTVILLVWLAKLTLIVSVPSVFGPLKLYSVSDLRPAELAEKEMVQTETGIQTARVAADMAVPVLKGINKERGGNYLFYGEAKPGVTVVLYLSDLQTVIYTGEADKTGYWEIRHLRQDLKLREGNHSVLLFSYDKQKGVRGEVSSAQYFRVVMPWQEALVNQIDVLANWSVVIIIILGIFLTFLTI